MSYDNFVQDYGKHVSFLENMGIKKAIKKVYNGHVPPRLIGPVMQSALETVLSSKNGCRSYYKTLLEYKYVAYRTQLKSEVKWNRELYANRMPIRNRELDAKMERAIWKVRFMYKKYEFALVSG